MNGFIFEGWHTEGSYSCKYCCMEVHVEEAVSSRMPVLNQFSSTTVCSFTTKKAYLFVNFVETYEAYFNKISNWYQSLTLSYWRRSTGLVRCTVINRRDSYTYIHEIHSDITVNYLKKDILCKECVIALWKQSYIVIFKWKDFLEM